MNWLIWRQHRQQFMVMGILLALFAVLLIPTGLHFWHVYQHARSTCGQTNTCSQLNNELLQSSNDQLLVRDLVPDAMLLLPILFGLFWGAPLLAREYSEGTNLLVWTRSISRRRWLTAKFVWMLVATAVFAGAFAALVTWWSKTPNALNLDRFYGTQFSTQNITPVAYSVFAVALGTALGAWFRRTMVALSVTLALLIAIVLVVVPNFVRPHYMTPVTVSASMAQGALDSKLPGGAWEVSRGFVDQYGQVSSSPFDLPHWPSQCQALDQDQQAPVVGAPKVGPADIDNCLTTAGYRQIAKYQPASRYWEFQRIEAGLYLALSVLPIGATYWLVLKRDA